MSGNNDKKDYVEKSSIQSQSQDDASAIHDGNSVTVAIDLNKLTKRFGDFTAIDNLTLTVKRGEIFGLLGPNGSGKTTTINMISGLSKPTSGVIRVLGYDILQDAKAVHAIFSYCTTGNCSL